ncbi:MAG: putative ABC transporter permease [Eubacteriales bacterium]|nr:putative ABC transporter permease [Eubacteriales bacterium]
MSDYQLQQLCYLILLFFVFSVLGWCMEVFLKYRQYHRFINRGFMIGPYCPIYGSGIVFITVMVNVLSGVETSVGTTFMISFLGCGALEYAVSYYMEKRYHARWWDYSTKPMNLNGRIWIGNLILFGIGGTLVIEVINPIVYSLFYRIPERVLYVLSVLVVLVMLSDNITSQFVMKFVKSSVENSEADNTESISKEIRMLMKDKSILYRRFADAYPDVIYRTDRIKRKMQEVKTEMERIQQEAAGNLERRLVWSAFPREQRPV